MLDVIPDVHGQAATLHAALAALGYRERNGVFVHPDTSRRALFLGDFIDARREDRPDHAGVLSIVRPMVESGSALAVMGNHELNAIHFHTPHPVTGRPLRRHSPENLRQHGAFLAEFPLGADRTWAVIDWMRTLPLWLEVESARFVHACWDAGSMKVLKRCLPDGRLADEQLPDSADQSTELGGAVETALKGIEVRLPNGHAFHDKNGKERHHVRLRWWGQRATDWRGAALSVSDPSRLPENPLPPDLMERVYPDDAPPVFFGHYWLTPPPTQDASNALCLDMSAGRGGPLASYRFEGEAKLDPARVTLHSHVVTSRP